MALRIPRSLPAAAVVMVLMVLSSPGAQGRDSPWLGRWGGSPLRSEAVETGNSAHDLRARTIPPGRRHLIPGLPSLPVRLSEAPGEPGNAVQGRCAVRPAPCAHVSVRPARRRGSRDPTPRRGRFPQLEAGGRPQLHPVSAGDAVYQVKAQCYFTNGTQRVRLVVRDVYNLEEIVRFDSDVGEHRAVTELGRADAEYYNSQTDLMERRRAEADTVCRHNYEVGELSTTLKRLEHPKVTVSLSKREALNHHNMLVCSVTDFYPGQIKVRWFRNDQEQTTGVVSTQLIRNGDWTFQILVMLEMTPQRGDVYTCHVEHPSLQSPVTVEWRAQSDSAQSKMLSGIGGFVLGLIFLGLGVFIRHRSQKGARGPPPTGLLH